MQKIILKLTGLKLVASALGLLYSILQVRFFGASGEVDAFFIATSSVYLITSLLQGGQLAEVFLPEYLKQKTTNGSVSAHLLLSSILTRILVFGLGALLILSVVAPFIIELLGPGLETKYKSLSLNLFYISLPLLLLTLIASFTNTTLNAEQIYGRAEMTGLVSSLVSTSLLILFHNEMGVYILVYALLSGKIIDFLITLYFLRKIGYRYCFTWSVPNYNINLFFKVMLTTSGYVLTTQFNVTLMTAMSSFLPVGSISIFNYVQQLSSKARGIISGPVNTVFFSKFSTYVAEKRANLENYIKAPLMGLVVVYFLISCFIFLSGTEILQILWSKKQLSINEFSIAYLMLSLNFFGMIIGNAGQVFRKVSVAQGMASLLYKWWIIVQLFSILYTFISIYYFGINGLISFPLVNSTLMASVCFYVAIKVGVNVKSLINKLFLTKSFIAFVVIISTLTYVINLFYGSIEIEGVFIYMLIKVASLSVIIVISGFVCYPGYLVKSIKKVIV